MTLGKLSVLALLARIFTLHQKWFKVAVYFWATWTLLWWTSGWFIIFLECRPLSTNWGVPTQCRPAFASSISAAVVNAVSDVGILFLPQPLIWQLHLPVAKKYALSVVFLLGGLYVFDPENEACRCRTGLTYCSATAIGIARVPLLKGANSSKANYDPTCKLRLYPRFYVEALFGTVTDNLKLLAKQTRPPCRYSLQSLSPLAYLSVLVCR